MLLAAARSSIPRIATSTAPRALAGSIRGFGIDTEYKKKEKVEEERFVREREREILEAKKKDATAQTNMSAAQQAAEAEAARKSALDATTQEAIHILYKTGDKVSAQGLENLAKWKMGF